MTNKRCLVACAGSGKTTFLVNKVREHFYNDSVIFVTFTTTNQRTICDKIRDKFGYHPSKIKVMGWYEFLFKFFILPYKSDIIPCLNTKAISLCFDPDYSRTSEGKNGQRFTKYKKEDKKGKYFTRKWGLHKDLVAEFACECLSANENAIAIRLDESCQVICFDESQDFGGSDFKIIGLICRRFSGHVLIATDPRQYIYSTSKYVGDYGGKIHDIIARKINTRKIKYVDIDTQTLSYSHRCISDICKVASQVFPNEPETQTCSCPECSERRLAYSGIKGVFAVKEDDISSFSQQFAPLNLVYSRRESLKAIGLLMSMGDSKGTESDVVLIYPTEDMAKFLFTDRDVSLKPATQSRLYVAITRARYGVGIVYRKKYKFENLLLPFWDYKS